MMEPVHNKTFGQGSIVFMDNHYFVRCTFKDCMLIYTGGEFSGMECKFEGNFSFNFGDAANRTLAFLAAFGMAPVQKPPSAATIPPSSKGGSSETTH